MNKIITFIILVLFFSSCVKDEDIKVTKSNSDLIFNSLAKSWDEAIPLGNGTVGALIWEKDGKLRFSLDRTDLWDLRPVDSLSGDNYNFEWVKEQIKKNDYYPVQKKFDHPYDMMPAPSKIPGAALEFNVEGLGDVECVRLHINNALCKVKWGNNISLKTFVQSDAPIGWFVFENLPEDITPEIIVPKYESENESDDLRSEERRVGKEC